MTDMKKICRNCVYAVVRRKYDDNAPNVICMKRTILGKGQVYLTQEDANCRNYYKPKKHETFRYGEWIPCSERLPESEEPEILCLVTYQDYDVSEGKWENERLGIMSYLTKHRIWNTKALVNVLAWQPLPEPYKEKKNNVDFN